MDLLFKEQVDFILSKGFGIKSMLFDSKETRQIINNLIPYSSLLENDYFYFDYIFNRKRTKINISCIVIIDSSNLKLLIEELVDPIYASYTILFKNTIDPFVLEILAGADRKAVIEEIHEINLSAEKVDEFFYQVNSNELYSVLNSLEINPSIFFQRNLENKSDGIDTSAKMITPEKLGNNISKITSEFKKPGKLLILNRNFDLITPLLCDWFYQSAIHQICDYKNSTVKIGNRKFKLSDQFFIKNKFENLQNVSENIKKIVKELENKKLKISNCQFDDIESATEYSKIVEIHLSVYTKVIDECMRNQAISDTEIGILKHDLKSISIMSNGMRELTKLHILKALNDGNKTNNKPYNDQIYNRKMPGGSKNSGDNIKNSSDNIKNSNGNGEALNDTIRSSNDTVKNYHNQSNANVPVEFLAFWKNFIKIYRPTKFPYKYSFNSESDLLSYESPIKRILRHLVKNKLNQSAINCISLNHHGGEKASSEIIIIYIIGGATFREYRDAMSQAKELGVNVYLMSDSLLKYDDILNLITPIYK